MIFSNDEIRGLEEGFEEGLKQLIPGVKVKITIPVPELVPATKLRSATREQINQHHQDEFDVGML